MAGDEIVAWTESPAAASVGKNNHSERLRRKAEDSFKSEAPPCESYRRFIHRRPVAPLLFITFTIASVTVEQQTHNRQREGEARMSRNTIRRAIGYRRFCIQVVRSSLAFHRAEKQKVQPHCETDQNSA
jgi:hypothetical protein